MNACECAQPQETKNPRRKGSCVKCGKVFDPAWVSSDAHVRVFFNRLSSCRYLEESFPAFRQMCERRERAGRETFGFQYLNRDNLAEGLEEAADLALYPYLDWLQAAREGRPDEDFDLVLTIAYHASLAFDAAVRLQHKRGGEP